MSPPVPMLSVTARSWPVGADWVLQPKWDGFRCLVQVLDGRRVKAWSRHGTSLTARLSGLLEPFAGVSAGTVYDGELVAIAERAGRPAQDFAAVRRAIFVGDPKRAAQLRFVAFDLLARAGRDLRSLPWRERDAQLRDALPVGERVRPIESLGATRAAHDQIVELGFEGTVLKRPGSLYRSGRHSAWRKHKASHAEHAILLSLRQDRERQWHAVCDAGGRKLFARAGAELLDRVGESVEVIYSRIDANGDLREARLSADGIDGPSVAGTESPEGRIAVPLTARG
jgi:ATP-dependent DNA ligase